MSTRLVTTGPQEATQGALTVTRLNVLRAGYLFMAAGLTVTRWPLLVDAADLSLHEGVKLCMLIAMSLLAWLGLRHPAKLLPILLFEVVWKVLWLAVVALPTAVTGELDEQTSEVVVNCSLVVVVLAVIPWRHVWRNYVRAPGEPWRWGRPAQMPVR